MIRFVAIIYIFYGDMVVGNPGPLLVYCNHLHIKLNVTLVRETRFFSDWSLWDWGQRTHWRLGAFVDVRDRRCLIHCIDAACYMRVHWCNGRRTWSTWELMPKRTTATVTSTPASMSSPRKLGIEWSRCFSAFSRRNVYRCTSKRTKIKSFWTDRSWRF